jgi:hypothetical protein
MLLSTAYGMLPGNGEAEPRLNTELGLELEQEQEQGQVLGSEQKAVQGLALKLELELDLQLMFWHCEQLPLQPPQVSPPNS